MSSSSSEASRKMDIEVVFETEIDDDSSLEPPKSEWSSIEATIAHLNPKRRLYALNLYTPGSGDVCHKYIKQSDSAIERHPYYRYPAVTDPGIHDALFAPEDTPTYTDDGQDRYLALCEQMEQAPVRLFHRGLVTSEINLSHYCVDPSHVRAMALALQYNQTVSVLNLTDNFLSLDSCYHLGQMLTCNNTLRELNLAGCRIGSEGLVNLGAGLRLNRCLVNLDISRNNLQEEGGKVFVNEIYEGATVTEVNLSYNELGPNAAVALAELLEIVNMFTHLDLSWNNLFTPGPTAKLLDRIAESPVLQELNLSWNALEGTRIAASISDITLVPTLKVLNLSNNNIRDVDVIETLIQNLHKAECLQELNLSNNPITPAGALLVLQKMLKATVTIQNLWMDNISVSKEFLETLERVRGMEARKNFNITYGRVLANWTTEGGADPRDLLLYRARFLASKKSRRGKIDLGIYLLQLLKDNKTNPSITTKEFIDRVHLDGPPLDPDLLTEMAGEFPGPRGQYPTINLQLIAEHVNRLWPETKLPPTPPPEPEVISKKKDKAGKGKGKGKGKKK